MRRAVSILIIATALVAGLYAAATAAAAASGRSKPTTITIHARGKLLHVANVDNTPTGRSAGDLLVFTERLSNTTGKAIGSDAATCTYLFDQRLLCSGVYILRGGQVFVSLVQPSLTGSLNYDQAITGGTGKYAGAGGTVTVHQRPAGDQFSFRIRLPSS